MFVNMRHACSRVSDQNACRAFEDPALLLLPENEGRNHAMCCQLQCCSFSSRQAFPFL